MARGSGWNRICNQVTKAQSRQETDGASKVCKAGDRRTHATQQGYSTYDQKMLSGGLALKLRGYLMMTNALLISFSSIRRTLRYSARERTDFLQNDILRHAACATISQEKIWLAKRKNNAMVKSQENPRSALSSIAIIQYRDKKWIRSFGICARLDRLRVISRWRRSRTLQLLMSHPFILSYLKPCHVEINCNRPRIYGTKINAREWG